MIHHTCSFPRESAFITDSSKCQSVAQSVENYSHNDRTAEENVGNMGWCAAHELLMIMPLQNTSVLKLHITHMLPPFHARHCTCCIHLEWLISVCQRMQYDSSACLLSLAQSEQLGFQMIAHIVHTLRIHHLHGSYK